ncbi:helix-hairpin-helix domain-containing protein [Desulfitobacterium sp.]|uniref:helix-hairpin-helix domain-containing protein n=1 Tax=Desulfitobacterium sp. TaxID=49981 RepID=UPI002C9120E1|nr:helix-hairpin-helix domain-containing protein [Desulfitobacterium sp.]HVJ50167.1 helix-hairpin-helix domain-containing protein [Desulfitobacterium sp.]
MERRMRYLWWGVLGVLVLLAFGKFFLPHGEKATVQKASSNREIVVYVSGAVNKSGLVHLPLDARLNDALKEANPLPEAYLEQLNPAEKLKDGQKIIVPFKAGMNPNESSVQSTPSSQPMPSPQPTQPANVAPPSTPNNGKININTAGVAELDKLPGIGPAFAERIIQYRTDNGPFAKPEDLQEVSGIGPKTYEKMASMVTTGP